MTEHERETYLYQMKYAQYLYKKYGDGALRDLEAYEIENMEKIWDKLGAEHGRSVEKLVELLWKGMGDDFEYSLDVLGENDVQIRCTKCPFVQLSHDHGMKEVGFSKYCMSDYGIVCGFNKNIEFTRTKTLMNGDECCDHRYRLID